MRMRLCGIPHARPAAGQRAGGGGGRHTLFLCPGSAPPPPHVYARLDYTQQRICAPHVSWPRLPACDVEKAHGRVEDAAHNRERQVYEHKDEPDEA